MKATLSLPLLAVLLIGLAQSAMHAQADDSKLKSDEAYVLRRISVGSREMGLPLQLQNAQLAVDNDRLEMRTAKLNGGEEDYNRLAADEYVLAVTSEAMQVSNALARAWLKTAASVDIEKKLGPVEARFDEADRQCHARDSKGKRIQYETAAQASAACAELHVLYSQVSAYRLISPEETPSLFALDQNANKRLGHRFYAADDKQRKSDSVAAHKDVRRELLRGDQELLDADREIWLTEISMDDVMRFNDQHPDHEMADMTDLVQHFTSFRNKLSKVNTEFRRSVRVGITPTALQGLSPVSSEGLSPRGAFLVRVFRSIRWEGCFDVLRPSSWCADWKDFHTMNKTNSKASSTMNRLSVDFIQVGGDDSAHPR